MNTEEKILDVMKGMEGIGGVPTPSEYYAEFGMRVKAALGLVDSDFISNVSVSQLMSERMTWLLDYVWCCDVNDLTDEEGKALEKRLAEEKAVIEWLYSR